jgi:predicted ATP-dependent endonuclease of OLD family
MKITQVIIKNWRSIKYVDFKTDAMNIFVGANNAGKTNIMSAINFLLGDRYPMPATCQTATIFFAISRGISSSRLTLKARSTPALTLIPAVISMH